MATKTKGQLEVIRWEAYKANGGKLGFWEWRNFGRPPGPGIGGAKTSPNVSATVTPPAPPPQTPGGNIRTTPFIPSLTPAAPWTPSPTPVASWAGQPYETQWREWFKATYPNENIDTANNIKAVREWWEKNILPTIIAGQTGINPVDVATEAAEAAHAKALEETRAAEAARRAELEERKFQWEVGQAEEEKRRRDWLEQVERDRQEAEARNKAWVLQYDIQKQASESAIEKQKNELELIKGRAFPFGDEEGRRLAAAQNMSSAFESARQSILSSLTSPDDWIKRWETENAPNPYTPQPKSRLEQDQSNLANTNTRINMFTQMASEAEKLVAQLSADPNYEGSAVLAQAKSDVANYSNAVILERGKLPAYQASVAYSQGQPQPEPSQPAQRGNAPAPGWLPSFAPGQRSGQAITRENVATPSAQQWTSTPWSVQQGLSGYLDWAGYRPMADVLGNMAQMLPNAPGGGSRWSPYIGR